MKIPEEKITRYSIIIIFVNYIDVKINRTYVYGYEISLLEHLSPRSLLRLIT